MSRNITDIVGMSLRNLKQEHQPDHPPRPFSGVLTVGFIERILMARFKKKQVPYEVPAQSFPLASHAR